MESRHGPTRLSRRTWSPAPRRRRPRLRRWPRAAPADLDPGQAREVGKRHDEAVRRLQDWIRQPSIAAENRGMSEGCELMIRMLTDAGLPARAVRVPTDGQPGVFATLDAGAPRTVGVYFMYDVKQVDPAEWTSPPWEAAHRRQAGPRARS